jgi:hypothetical protein
MSEKKVEEVKLDPEKVQEKPDLKEARKELNEKFEIPPGYIEIKLSTKGRIG